MEEQSETREEAKHSRGFGWYALWAGVVLVLYMLSVGPYYRIITLQSGKAVSPSTAHLLDAFATFYRPIGWAARYMGLRRPIGMYLRLWCPEWFDKNGDMKQPTKRTE